MKNTVASFEPDAPSFESDISSFEPENSSPQISKAGILSGIRPAIETPILAGLNLLAKSAENILEAPGTIMSIGGGVVEASKSLLSGGTLAEAKEAANKNIAERRGLGTPLAESVLVKSPETETIGHTIDDVMIFGLAEKAYQVLKTTRPVLKAVASAAETSPEMAEAIKAEASIPGNPLSDLFRRKLMLDRALNSQKTALDAFAKKYAGRLDEPGIAREIAARQTGIQKTSNTLQGIEKEIDFAKLRPQVKPVVEAAEARAVKDGLGAKSSPELLASAASEKVRFAAAPEPSLKDQPSPLGIELSPSLDKFIKKVTSISTAADTLDKDAGIVLEHVGEIERIGTVPETAREALRKAKPLPESAIRRIAVSRSLVDQIRASVIVTAREYERTLASKLTTEGDALTANVSDQVSQNLKALTQRLNTLSTVYKVPRFASNRILLGYYTEWPPDVAATFKKIGSDLTFLKQAKAREGFWDEAVKALKSIRETPAESSGKFLTEVVNAAVLNFIGPASFVMDSISNTSVLVTQAGGAAAKDAVLALRGDGTFAATRGFLDSLRNQFRVAAAMTPEKIGRSMQSFQAESGMTAAIGEAIESFGKRVGSVIGKAVDYPPLIKSELSSTAFSQPLREGGAFLTRTTIPRTIVDLAAGLGIYPKGLIDSTAGRVAAMARVFERARESADALKLSGAARTAFYEKFMFELPESVATEAVNAANQAKFSKSLSAFEKITASNPLTKLFVDPFLRWPYQFSRVSAEILFPDVGTTVGFAKGKVKIEEMARMLGQRATGWGGLWFVKRTIYDNVDWDTMNYMLPNGNPIRLANVDPLPSALWLLSMLNGDADKAKRSFQFTSIPFAKTISGQGGILSGLAEAFQRYKTQRGTSPFRLEDELTSTINRLIPGQALLSAIKTMLDPVLREGVGANLPVVSKLQKAKPSGTTGEDQVLRQRFPPVVGKDLPVISGVPIPGAERLLDPVEKMLYSVGITVKRGLRQSVAAVPESGVSDDMKDDWVRFVGKNRQIVYSRYADNPEELNRFLLSDIQSRKVLMDGMERNVAKMSAADMIVKYGPNIQDKINPPPRQRLLGAPERFRR